MPLAPGTYPIGGPLVLTSEKPSPSESLYASNARWLGPNGYEVVERSGSSGNYRYSWVVKPESTGNGNGGSPAPSGPADSIGRIDVNPEQIAASVDLDGTYQCILSLTDAEVSTLSSAGVNYLEIWFGSETVHVVSPWSPVLVTRIDAVVDTTEETAIGSTGSVLAVRAVYRINQSGSQTYYAEGAGALRVGGFDVTTEERIARQRGDTFTVYTVQTIGTLNSALEFHARSDNASIFFVNGNYTTPVRTYTAFERYYLAPHHSTEGQMVQLSNAPSSSGSGQSASQVQAAIAAALPPFADIRLLPGSLPGSDMPDDFYVELSDKLISRTIDGLTLNVQGQTFRPHASTPVSGFDTEGQALVRFDISAQSQLIANGISTSTRFLIVDLTFSFTEGADYRRRITLPVNNPLAPRLVPEALDTIVFNANLAIDWLSTDMRSVTLTANVTFTFTNIQIGRPIVLEIRQDATGGKTITWPSSVEWAGGSAEGPSAGGGKVDIYTLLPLTKTRVLAAALLSVS